MKLKGHPVKRLLAQAGLDQRSLNADGARIPFDKHAAFFELAAEVTRDNCLGLHFGQTRETRDAGLIGYVGLSSPTLMDAIKNLARYRRVFSDAVEIEIGELEERGRLRWWFHGAAAQRPRQCLEFSAANFLRAFREMSGRNLAPAGISFTHPRHKDIEEFERFFGCPVSFGGRENVIEMKLSDLHVQVTTADNRLLLLLRRYCEDVLSKHAASAPPLVETVERLIVERLTKGEAGLDAAATELGMSPRSLSRKLAELGTSFNAIVASLRKDLARRYLQESDLSLTEIAFLLGYTEISTFSHAFKRWTGITPTASRRRESG
ncbi:MAG: AraC family transcriptional regulator [Alphaproteobacteria bacterium]